MARRAFFSFHYRPDYWRAAQVRNMGTIDGNSPCSDNDWETITSSGDSAIEKWIADQMYGKSCVIVLIGSLTAGRKWINYEIKKGWNDGKGVLGVYVHGLKDVSGQQASKGGNPFDHFAVDGTSLSSIVKAYDPPYISSTYVHSHIKNNLADWIEEAISIRGDY
jgi:hypothetical protein